MPHLPELYYLQDQRDFPFQKAVVITATTIARWSKYYFTRLIAPKENIVAPFERSVGLSTDEQEIFISELICVRNAKRVSDGNTWVNCKIRPVAFPFFIPNDDLAIIEIHIHDSQAQTFGHSQIAVIQEAGNQTRYAGHLADERQRFLMRDNYQQMFRAVRTEDIGRNDDFLLEDVFVQKHDGAERLALCGSFAAALVVKIGDIGLHFVGA